MKPDDLDALYPQIDENACINCGLCEKTCPNNRNLQFQYPKQVLAAWSRNSEIRRTSASGGVAFELYRYWLSIGGAAAGVVYDRDEGCHYILIEKTEDIKQAQNSKYTFSDTRGIYISVKERLQQGIPFLFIGLPCQVAGLLGFLKKDYDNLTTVDIICHGIPPATYLEQHVLGIEQQRNKKTKELFFRDPKYHTYTFTFTLRDEESREFYNKKVLTSDNYQLGYHRALIYRENCYSCRFARAERISDLTIGDFSGLGTVKPVRYQLTNTSCILVNSSKVTSILEKVGTALETDERPPEEALNIEKQLNAPSLRHPGRSLFETVYRETRDFEEAASRALVEEKNKARKQRRKLKVKVFIKAFIPWTLVRTFKKTLKG